MINSIFNRAAETTIVPLAMQACGGEQIGGDVSITLTAGDQVKMFYMPARVTELSGDSRCQAEVVP